MQNYPAPRQCWACNGIAGRMPIHCEGRSPKCECYCTRNDPVVRKNPQLNVYRRSGVWYQPYGAKKVTLIAQGGADGEPEMTVLESDKIPLSMDVIVTGGTMMEPGFAVVITEF